jgi:hypothetical protein
MTAQNIYARLVAAQSEFCNIEQTNRAQAFKGGGYNYANINDCLEAVRPTLNKHGLVVMQKMTTEANRVGVETLLYSPEGESLSSGVFFVPVEGMTQKGAQAFGSACTYARRYSLMSFLGLSYGENDDGYKDAYRDDDGRAASEGAYNKKPQQAAPRDFTALEVKAREFETATLDEYAAFFKALSKEDKAHLTDTGIHASIKQKLSQ